ncbi:MAG TPA: SMP-30/gluconolactonase/LRE family protein [Terracidiphilus sp.]|nr:SMP-30/gluconolactonase/LRE family protein [Terracidiphilus sp.]
MKWTKPDHLLVLVAVAILSATGCKQENPPQTAGPGSPRSDVLNSTQLKVDRLDPRLDAIVPSNAVLERVATGFKWVEGPVWADGSLYFAEIPSNRICKWSPGAGVTTFLTPSGYLGSKPYGGPEPGSNGMTLDSQGRLTVAGHAQRDVYRFESLQPDGARTILADTYRGKRLNSPNDLVYRSDGSLYFTDPPYGLRTQKDDDPEKELKVNGVYRIPRASDQKAGAAPDRGALQLLVSNLTRPNGIAFSPDEKYLYVDNSEPKKIWMRYRVRPDGSLTDAKLLYDATADKRPGAPDGMKVDEEGNIYSAGPGGVWIFSPEGKPLGTILIPERVANLAWAGPDRKTLYITASSSIYRVRLSVTGAPLIRKP